MATSCTGRGAFKMGYQVIVVRVMVSQVMAVVVVVARLMRSGRGTEPAAVARRGCNTTDVPPDNMLGSAGVAGPPTTLEWKIPYLASSKWDHLFEFYQTTRMS